MYPFHFPNPEIFTAENAEESYYEYLNLIFEVNIIDSNYVVSDFCFPAMNPESIFSALSAVKIVF